MSGTIIIDSGSGYIKAGIGGDTAPKLTFASILEESVNDGKKKSLIGEIDLSNSNNPRARPIQNGLVQNWEDMESIWKHTLSTRLQVNPSEHNILVIDSPQTSRTDREKAAQILLETFQCAGVFFLRSSVASLRACKKTSGLVVDIGEDTTSISPISNNWPLRHAISQSNIAGREIDQHLSCLLSQEGLSFHTASEMDTVRDIKEKICYIAPKIDHSDGFSYQQYQLPCNKQVTISEEAFQAPEILFNPARVGREEFGVADMVFKAIMKSDPGMRSDMWGNIVLSGGSTMFKGMLERLKGDLGRFDTRGIAINIKAPADRKTLAWRGAAIKASEPGFEAIVVSKDEYEENGASFVHRRCY
ncbi:hypothetical protein BGZ60DRAFT_18604 [Tricladium varicosporioides]|nr:hypothetical protein BGZ60DRAFT_18604 [Hymenoscyphus varicosporioides]